MIRTVFCPFWYMVVNGKTQQQQTKQRNARNGSAATAGEACGVGHGGASVALTGGGGNDASGGGNATIGGGFGRLGGAGLAG